MPSFVVKLNPAEDRYVYWSTVTDSPHFWGSRVEMAEWLAVFAPSDDDEARLLRADTFGTSSHIGDTAWDDDVLIVEQRGILRRSDLGAFLDSFDATTGGFDWTLLEPFEDDDLATALADLEQTNPEVAAASRKVDEAWASLFAKPTEEEL